MPRGGAERETTTSPQTNFGLVLTELKAFILPFGANLTGKDGLTLIQVQEVSRLSRNARRIASMHPENRQKIVFALSRIMVNRSPHPMDDELKVGVASFITEQLIQAIQKDIEEVRDIGLKIRIGKRISELTGRSCLQLLIDISRPGVTWPQLVELWNPKDAS